MDTAPSTASADTMPEHRTRRSRVATIEVSQELIAYSLIMGIDPSEAADRLLAAKLAEVNAAIRAQFKAANAQAGIGV